MYMYIKQLFSKIMCRFEVMNASKTRLQFMARYTTDNSPSLTMQEFALTTSRDIITRYFCVWYVTIESKGY